MTKSTMSRAIEAHQAGELVKAERLYQQILKQHADDISALHMLAVICYQKNEHERALEYFNTILPRGINDPGLFNNLGNVYLAKGQLDQALKSFTRSIQLDHRFFLAYHNIGNIHRFLNNTKKAYDAYKNSVSIQPDYIDSLVSLGNTCISLNRNKEATDCFNRVLKLDPSNEIAQHMMASLKGKLTEQAPTEYVSRLFDHYSSNFDSHLVDALEYDIPVKISDDLRRNFPDRRFNKVLDLGCGTGLVGEAINDMADETTGVDLSLKMIDKARQRDIYQRLFTCDVSEYLVENHETYDLIVCADVFPYIGKLSDLLDKISHHLQSASIFIFSTEISDKHPYELLPTGRYAHSEDYVTECLHNCGINIYSKEVANIRKQENSWIKGNYIIAQK